MRIKITSILAAGLLSLPLVALAADATPKKGSSKDTVRSQYGAPVKQIPGVGTPSISRWEYPGFTVYFEDNLTLHTVRHATALAQPPAPAPVETLPAIEEIGDETGTAAAAATPVAEAATETTAEQPAAETESAFRFDPVSGRIIEVGADGKAIASPAAQATPQAPKEAPVTPAETETPAAETEAEVIAEPEVTEAADLEKEKAAAAAAAATAAAAEAASKAEAEAAAAPVVAPKVAPKAAPSVAPKPAPAATTAEPGAPQFRFDPVSGRIVVDDPAATETAPAQPEETAAPAPAAQAAPSEAPKQSEPTPTAESTPKTEAAPKAAPKAEPEAKKEEEESGGFSVDWN